MRLVLIAAVATFAVGSACNDVSTDGRYVTKGVGGVDDVAWDDVHTDFGKLAKPGSLTFVELSGPHCGGCKKNAKVFKQLAEKRPDVAVRVVMFPEELCLNDKKSAECRTLIKETRALGGCFTPTLYAYAPDGALIAKDDTCKDQRPGAAFFHAFADKELGVSEDVGTRAGG